MSSPIGSMRNVKIFVLYLMQNVGYPLDYITLGEVVMQTDYVAYLDLAEAFHQMLDDGLLAQSGVNEAGEPCYVPTEKGICVAESLRGDILSSILDQSLTAALRYLDFTRRGVKVHCAVTKNPTEGYDIECSITERDKTLLSLVLWVDSRNRADRMEAQFREHPENVYRGLLALMSGNVNYLLG